MATIATTSTKLHQNNYSKQTIKPRDQQQQQQQHVEHPGDKFFTRI